MKFVKPKANDTFTITSIPTWPTVEFETDVPGAHDWHWTIEWGAFKKSGVQRSVGNRWNAAPAIADHGGTLSVRAEANNRFASIAVKLRGTNPTAADVSHYLLKAADGVGFDKIIAHESKFRHFATTHEPVRSFDNGYGMCQLTTPRPTFEQVWNWKLNVDGGLKLFAEKRATAIRYLSQSNRTYTRDELLRETICRWNGGAYHVWDSKAAKWVRSPNILCASGTGNIGWDMTDPENKGKTGAALYKRDAASFSKAPKAGAHWRYSGVCYADRLLG